MKQWTHLEQERILDSQLRSWWFQGKRVLLDAVLAASIPREGRVLDVGAGQGLFANHHVGNGRLFVLDDWMACLSRNRERGGRPMQGSATQLPVKDAQFDCVLAFDVLEHLPDDHLALLEWGRVLKPGGTVVLNVPALNALWSEHDVLMGHYRRYAKHTLRAVFEESGFKVERMAYSNFALLPAAWAGYRLGFVRVNRHNPEAHKPLSPVLEHLLLGLYKAEAAWVKNHSFPLGTSLIGVATKTT